MARGRRKDLVAVKQLRGTLRPEDRPDASLPSGRKITELKCCKVAGLALLSDDAKKIYRDVCKGKMLLNVLDKSDLPMILIFATQYELYIQSYEEVRTQGKYLTVKNEIGEISRIIKNPALEVMNSSARLVASYGSILGITPTERQKLGRSETVKPSTNILNFILNGSEPEEQ